MQYRGIEYQVVQTANPTGWKWTVTFDGGTKTGGGYNRVSAIAFAQLAIDKLLHDHREVGIRRPPALHEGGDGRVD